jgi:hypothetical protein
MFLVPLTMRDFFFEDPYFQSSWYDYDRLRDFMFRQPRDIWKRFDDDFRQLACMANNIMVDLNQQQDLLRLERERSRTVPIKQQQQQQQEERAAVKEGEKDVAPMETLTEGAAEKSGAEGGGAATAEPMETEGAGKEKAAAVAEKEGEPRERKSSRELRLAAQDPLARWQRSWMFPRRWMLPSLEAEYEKLFRDLELFRERDGDVVRFHDDKDGLEITFDVSHYRPDELRVSVQGGVICVEGRHEEGDEGRKQISKHFLRR